MASASGIRAGKAYVEIHGKDDGLKSTLSADAKAVEDFQRKMAESGQRLLASTATAQEQYRTRLAEYRQLLQHGAISQTTFNRAVAQARKELGITSVAERAAKSVRMVTAAVAQLAQRVAVGGFGLLTTLAAAGKSYADNAPELSRRAGSGINAAEVRQARELKTAFSTLGVSIQIAWAQIGAAVAPVLKDTLLGISQIVQGVSRWVQNNRPLIASAFEIAKSVAAWSAGLFVAAKALGLVVAGVALFASPLGALIAAVAAGTAAWLTWSSSGQRAFAGVRDTVQSTIGWLQERFGALYKDFSIAWAGIVAAVSKGDLATAGELAWVTLKLTFFEAVKAMGGNWNTFYKSYLETIALIGDAWDVLWTRLQQGWNFVFTRLQQGWRSTQNVFAKGISTILGTLEGKTAEERQQVWDELDDMTARDNAAAESAMVKRDTELETSLMKGITARQQALTKALEELPASDQARIDKLRARRDALIETAKEGSPTKPMEYREIIRMPTAGTFNAAAAQSLQGGTALDAIRKNTADTARNTKEIASARQPDNLRFDGGSP